MKYTSYTWLLLIENNKKQNQLLFCVFFTAIYLGNTEKTYQKDIDFDYISQNSFYRKWSRAAKDALTHASLYIS